MFFPSLAGGVSSGVIQPSNSCLSRGRGRARRTLRLTGKRAAEAHFFFFWSLSLDDIFKWIDISNICRAQQGPSWWRRTVGFPLSAAGQVMYVHLISGREMRSDAHRSWTFRVCTPHSMPPHFTANRTLLQELGVREKREREKEWVGGTDTKNGNQEFQRIGGTLLRCATQTFPLRCHSILVKLRSFSDQVVKLFKGSHIFSTMWFQCVTCPQMKKCWIKYSILKAQRSWHTGLT